MGIDTVICGPGNIMCAHKPNEFVLMSDLIKYERSLSEVLVICEDDNDISKHMLIKAINTFGGYEDTPQEKDGKKMLRYWIKTIA